MISAVPGLQQSNNATTEPYLTHLGSQNPLAKELVPGVVIWTKLTPCLQMMMQSIKIRPRWEHL